MRPAPTFRYAPLHAPLIIDSRFRLDDADEEIARFSFARAANWIRSMLYFAQSTHAAPAAFAEKRRLDARLSMG